MAAVRRMKNFFHSSFKKFLIQEVLIPNILSDEFVQHDLYGCNLYHNFHCLSRIGLLIPNFMQGCNIFLGLIQNSFLKFSTNVFCLPIFTFNFTAN